MLVLFGLKKKFELNLSIVRLLGSNVNGRLKVMIVVPGTSGLRQGLRRITDGEVQMMDLGHRASAYSAGTIISVKKENVHHCRPLK